jgi:hypothetical protein
MTLVWDVMPSSQAITSNAEENTKSYPTVYVPV